MIPLDIQKVLEAKGLTALEFEEGSTPAAVSAVGVLRVETGQIAKSIVLKGKNGNFFMIVCAGDKKINTKKAKDFLGTKVRMAHADELFETTGFKPGEVCPFRSFSIPVFIDRSLSRYDFIYPAAGTDSSAVPLSFIKLSEITGAEECDIAD